VSEEKRERLSTYWTRTGSSPIEQKGTGNWVEQQIQEAMARGAFDNLPGKGKPLPLKQEHPWETQDWLPNHLLANAHYAPEWAELQKQIDEDLVWLKTNPGHAQRSERIGALNKKIDRFNLVAPAWWMQRGRYSDPENA